MAQGEVGISGAGKGARFASTKSRPLRGRVKMSKPEKHHLPVTLTNEPSHLKSPSLPRPCRTNTDIHQKTYGNVGCLALPPSKFLVTNISVPVKSTLLTAKGWGLLIQFREQSRRTRSSVSPGRERGGYNPKTSNASMLKELTMKIMR